MKALSNFGLLTLKPLLILVNLDEEDVSRTAEIEAQYREQFSSGGTSTGAMCARLEAELAELEPEEAAEFRREMGAAQPEAPRILALAQEMLGLITFFTAGDTECRAWPLAVGTAALEAAGRIHTDIERGFIRAEVIRWDELLAAGGFSEAKKHGRLRSEGKQYLVQDGDVVNVLFSV
jgi:ribosome-binding ATPase YchF (GTP1/OBG family)